ncbi:hypothetical protein LCGC14_0140700 [marine sediment metagenome]|uniref:ATP-grasp domain-containing protein n=1 Tax=marine sediment metagenome TaxID=412755 RepID=A0A0F9V4D3_9ZZZZ
MDRLDWNNRNRLSWWFPKIPKEILVPETRIFPKCVWADCGANHFVLIGVLDGRKPEAFDTLCWQLKAAGDELGYPFFLRTDYLSGKHGWNDTCFVTHAIEIPCHVARLIEESIGADILGFPPDCWIARKMISTIPSFFAFHGDMPIVKERRYFVQDSKVLCHHPYWPSEAFDFVRVSIDSWPTQLDEMNYQSSGEISLLSDLSAKVGGVVGGAWSIDWLWSEPEQQWYLIDMAEAETSYHWKNCFNFSDVK